MEEQAKKTGKETIEFQDQQSEVENLRAELANAKEEADRYLQWWHEGNSEREKLQEKLDVLLTKMDKVAAVAGLYISSKAWKK